jgi:hypothetical protein
MHFNMSTEEDKFKKSRRILQDEVAVQRQVKIAKDYGVPIKDPHKFAKRHALNCGNPNCVMCGNPRKFWGEETMQEKRFKQTTTWDEMND